MAFIPCDELFKIDNDFHDAVVRLATVSDIGVAEVLEQLNDCANALTIVTGETAGYLELYGELFEEIEELKNVRPPSEIKKELKHEKNPMRIKQLNRELTESYKYYRRK